MIIAYSLALIAYLIAEIQRYMFYRLVRPYWISESWLIEASAALLPSRGQREACPDVEGFGFVFPSKSRFDERFLKSGSSIRLVMSGASKNVRMLKRLIKKIQLLHFFHQNRVLRCFNIKPCSSVNCGLCKLL